MANWWYTKGLEAFANGNVDWMNDNIKFAFIDGADYTLDSGEGGAGDQYYHQITGESGIAVIANSANLSSKNCDLGIFDAADETVNSVTGDQFEYIIVYKDTGTPTTSPLLFGYDTASGLPFTPSGSNIQVQWDSGEYKMAAL